MTQVVLQLYASGAEYMAPLLAAAEGARNQLHTYIESNLAFIGANKEFVAAAQAVVLNLRDADGNLIFIGSGGEDEILAPLVALLHDGQRSGDFSDFDAVVMAKLIRDSIDGVAVRAVREPDFDTGAYIAGITRLFDLATRKDLAE
jgi:hypothetical protein